MTKQNDNINVSVTFRNTEPTPALKKYANDKIANCLSKYLTSDADALADIVLSVQKRDHIAEVKVKYKRFDISGKAVTEDLYSAIDKVVDTLLGQLRKQKERTTDHKRQAAPVL